MTRALWVASCMAALAAACGGVAAELSSDSPLEDPVPDRIMPGDIWVDAVDWIRAPRTYDGAHPPLTNDAYARIQYVMPAPDDSDRLFFNDLRGLLYVVDQGMVEVFLDLRQERVAFYPDEFPNEAGFLGFAFHPDFIRDGSPGYGKFYTSFSARADSGVADHVEEESSVQESVVYEWTDADPSDNTFSGTYRELLRVGQFMPYHNIGTLGFNTTAEEGSADHGMLYLSLGDGGGAHDPKNNGQNTNTPLGAILRIDPLGGAKYGIPPDNPFASGDEALPEIWAYGLRHPQHFSWAPDGRLFISDIGQDQIEEINVGVAGANYGWRLREGTFATAYGAGSGHAPGSVFAVDTPVNFTDPVAQYDHDEGFALGSGFVYSGSAIPELRGKYVFADIVLGRVFYMGAENLVPGHPARIYELNISYNGEDVSAAELAGYPNTYRDGGVRVDMRLGIDGDGELYLLTKGDGWIRKIMPSCEP